MVVFLESCTKQDFSPHGSRFLLTSSLDNLALTQKSFHAHYRLDGHNEIDGWNIVLLNNVKQMSS